LEWGAWGGFGGRAGGIKNGLRLAVRRKRGLGRAGAEEGPDGAAPGGHASQGPFLNSCRQGGHQQLLITLEVSTSFNAFYQKYSSYVA